MMRKFYRNRHTSFLQALVAQKAKKEQDEKAIKDKEEKRKQKVTQKVIGDGSRIKPKLYDPRAPIEEPDLFIPVPPVLAALSKNQLGSTSKSTTTATQSKQSRSIRRGNSVSSLSQAEKAYNDATPTGRNLGSRGSSRAGSSRGDSAKKAANRSAQNFSRGRTLTPMMSGGKAAAAKQ